MELFPFRVLPSTISLSNDSEVEMTNQDDRSVQQEAAQRGREILDTVKRLIQETDDQDGPASLIAAGKIREVAQTYQLAVECYIEALRADPKNGEAKARLAIAYLKSGAVAKGLAVIADLAEQQPKLKFHDISGRPASVQTVLGDAHRDDGNLPEAKRAYTAALELQPNDVRSAVFLAQIYADEGNLEQAAELEARTASGGLEQFGATVRLMSTDPTLLPSMDVIARNGPRFVTAEC
jgi:tetratricopeptide (TPR) repeat protein